MEGFIRRLQAMSEDPNVAFEIREDLKKRVGELQSMSAPAPNLAPPPPRPPSPVDLEPPKLPPLDSGDVEPSFRISVGPSPEWEHYLSLGYKPVAIIPPRPPSPKDDEPQKLQVATLDKAALPPLPPLEVDPAYPGNPQGVKARVAKRIAFYRKRNGLPPELPPLKRPKKPN
jgi:hypothetical protein